MSEYVTNDDMDEMTRAIFAPDSDCVHNVQPLNDLVEGIVRREVARALREVPDAWLAYTSCDDGDGGDDFDHWIKSYAAASDSEGQS